MTPPASTPGEQRRLIEQLRARFEAGWQAGDPPALEDLLAEVHPQAQPELLRELLVLECDHRKHLGRPLTADEARRRFARVGGWLAGVLASLGLDSSPSAGMLRLEVTAGPCLGRTFDLADHSTFLIGRGPTGVHLAIEGDPNMSRLHCLIEYNPPHARVADLRSKNGTFVNGKKIEQADLREGDEIRVGQTALRVRLGGEGRTITIEGVEESHSTVEPAQGCGLGVGIPGYEILEELGRGGMGVVYKARRVSDGQLVALKTVLPAVPPFAETLARFRREAEILRQLVHPCIVRFHETGESRGILYFAMELVEGESAARLVERRGPLRADRAVALGRHLLDALAFAHDRKIVHRDVKPGNVLLARRGKRVVVKLADFGLARVYQASAMSGLTMAGTPGGTPGFMPPEQVLNFRHARPAADQYSAAATLYYLLTGKPIYQPANNGVDQLLRTLEEEPLPLREPEEGPPLPGRLRDVFKRALARDPDARYPDVRAMRDALAKSL